ncbi:MAG: 23S rRNA (pseudouridine(1915)-N(3))-methyltransferase RlmH [Candidatus Zophobacter franzmannii]|nr:23S rRNA (pseudouridine(1915)-N(3))-methyltransferase RlmH [Candidatus Zophobacter franzmannii]
MQIRIICPGKTKDNYLNVGIEEYIKRVSPWVKVTFLQIPDVKLSNSNNVAQVKSKEAEIIFKHLNPSNYTIALDEIGELLSTKKLTNIFLKNMGEKNIDFVIGGVYGLDKSVRDKVHLVLSFSRMTFTHQMIRLILTEQIYRCFTIMNNKKYHY